MPAADQENPQLPPRRLTQLANEFGTDKGTFIGNAHNYTLIYEFLFEQFRDSEFSMLEIGLERGDISSYRDGNRPVSDVPSVRMWLEYFLRAKCYGFDNADFGLIQLDRFTFLRGDLSSAHDLAGVAKGLFFKIVIDDGSHASWHQQLAFAHLFPKVEPGGFYVIEDLDFQPPYENELPSCLKTADVFQRYLDNGELSLTCCDSTVNKSLKSMIGDIFVLRADMKVSGAHKVRLMVIRRGSIGSGLDAKSGG